MSQSPLDEESGLAPTKFGRYDVVELLATGGMARVYKATTSQNRVFTIKKILPEFSRNDEFIKMFLEEAKISLSLKHSNIVRVIDFGQIENTYYLAMEYVFGRDVGSLLKRTLEKKIHVPVDVACQIIIQCCRGMEYAHRLTDAFGTSLGIIHRDISPPNILVSYNGEVKILDFGIAKAISAAENRNTRSGVLKGKFSYMSPEQTRGEFLTAQSDLFSLGIVLHELLTSRSLFYTKDELETLEKVRKAEVKAPSSIRKGIPEALDRIVLKALQPKLKKRLNSCAEFADELEVFLQENYPRTDKRAVAKFMRLMFQEDFNGRLEIALKEGWKDIFVSGGDDQELMLDRAQNLAPTRTPTQGFRLSTWQRLLYDPKVSDPFFKTLRFVGYACLLVVVSWIFVRSEIGQNLFQSWKRSFSKTAPVESTPTSPPLVETPQSLERGSLAWWVQEAEVALAAGQDELALDNLGKALKINPYEKDLVIRHHFLQLKLGLGNACDWFQTHTELEPKDQLLARAACAELAGDPSKAVVAYSDFVRRFPKDLRAPKVERVLKNLLGDSKR